MDKDRYGCNYCVNCGEKLQGSFTIVEKKKGIFGYQKTSFCNNYDACVDKCLATIDAGFEIVTVEIE